MGIPVRLDAFEGPLDLLLHLIEKNKINIYDIPITEITEQYMEYISHLTGQTLEVMSEFLVMAATLLDIKSRMLLPAEVTDNGEEIDPRGELVQKLLEYKMYKYMSYELRDREEDAALRFYKGASIPDEVRQYREPADPEQLLDGVTLQRLYAVYCDIIKRQENRIDPIRSRFGQLKKEEIDLGDTMRFVARYIAGKRNCSFREILSMRPGKQYRIVTFLTLLELMKEGRVAVEQPDAFADIQLTWTGKDSDEELADIGVDYD